MELKNISSSLFIAPISSTSLAIPNNSNLEVSEADQSIITEKQQAANPITVEVKDKKIAGVFEPTRSEMAEEQWAKLIEKANKALEGAEVTFDYKIHEATKQIMIKVINKETKEVIREIPPEKIVDLAVKILELAGLLLDERR